MSGMGVAMMGTGIAEGENRAMEAAQKAISSPLLEDSSVNGARGVIINVTGGPDLSLMEVNEASCVIQEAAHEDANIIFGAVVDPTLDGQGEDHRDRHRLRPQGRRRAACRRPRCQTPVDLPNYTAHLRRRRRKRRGRAPAARCGCGRRGRDASPLQLAPSRTARRSTCVAVAARPRGRAAAPTSAAQRRRCGLD